MNLRLQNKRLSKKREAFFVACSKVPILFIHGGADKFVPTRMVHELYAAAPGSKELLIVPEAEHAGAAYTDTEKYWTAVFDFAAKHSSMHKNG